MVGVWLEKFSNTTPHPSPPTPPLFFFCLLCEPQRKRSSEEGPPPTKTKDMLWGGLEEGGVSASRRHIHTHTGRVRVSHTEC